MHAPDNLSLEMRNLICRSRYVPPAWTAGNYGTRGAHIKLRLPQLCGAIHKGAALIWANGAVIMFFPVCERSRSLLPTRETVASKIDRVGISLFCRIARSKPRCGRISRH